MSKYRTSEEWGDGIRTRFVVILALAVILFITLGLLGSDRKREAEFISTHELSIDDIRQQAEDPDSYRF